MATLSLPNKIIFMTALLLLVTGRSMSFGSGSGSEFTGSFGEDENELIDVNVDDAIIKNGTIDDVTSKNVSAGFGTGTGAGAGSGSGGGGEDPRPQPFLYFRCNIFRGTEVKEQFQDCCRNYPPGTWVCPNRNPPPPGHICGSVKPPACCCGYIPPPPPSTTEPSRPFTFPPSVEPRPVTEVEIEATTEDGDEDGDGK